jgi:Carboxypeptidase regulatory-like domain
MAREHKVAYASVLPVVGLFVVNCRPAFSQTITGDISGQVTDSTGAVLPNVTVTAVNSGTNFSRSATTNDAGNFRIPDLPIGQYKITATAPGFKTAVQAAEVRAGAIAQASFKMAVGQRSEVVEVQGSAPLVELSPNENNCVDSLKIETFPSTGAILTPCWQ